MYPMTLGEYYIMQEQAMQASQDQVEIKGEGEEIKIDGVNEEPAKQSE